MKDLFKHFVSAISIAAGIFSAFWWVVSADLQKFTNEAPIPKDAIIQFNMTVSDANLYAAYAAAVAAFAMAISHGLSLYKD